MFNSYVSCPFSAVFCTVRQGSIPERGPIHLWQTKQTNTGKMHPVNTMLIQRASTVICAEQLLQAISVEITVVDILLLRNSQRMAQKKDNAEMH